MAVIREMIERNHINLQKINNKHQLADVLSEKGASNTLLTDVLKEGKMRRFKFWIIIIIIIAINKLH